MSGHADFVIPRSNATRDLADRGRRPRIWARSLAPLGMTTSQGLRRYPSRLLRAAVYVPLVATHAVVRQKRAEVGEIGVAVVVLIAAGVVSV